MKKTIKLADGVILTYDGEQTILQGMADVWDAFNWNIKNDKQANECALEITRQLLCFGFIDLTPMCNGHTCTLKLIPPTNN